MEIIKELKSKRRVSIVVAVYNIEEYIYDCLKSIGRQTYPYLEIIVVDDGSKDNSGEICDSFAKKDNRVKVIHQLNQGLSAARNTGIAQSTGQYIMFVDGDDKLPQNSVENLLLAILQTGADFSQGLFCYEYENGKMVDVEVNQPRLQIFEQKEAVQSFLESGPDGIEVAAWGKLYKKSLFDYVKYPVGLLHEDMYTTCDLVLKQTHKVVVINDIVYIYRQHEKSITHEKSRKRYEHLLNSQIYVHRQIESCFPELQKLSQYMLYYIICQIIYDDPEWLVCNCKNLISKIERIIRKIPVRNLIEKGLKNRRLFHFLLMRISLIKYMKLYSWINSKK